MSPRYSPHLIDAVIQAESGGNPKAESAVGAKGLMQLMDATGLEWHDKLGIGEPYDPFNPVQNQRIGSAYLMHLIDHYNGQVPLALAAYNWGPGHVDKATHEWGASWRAIELRVPTETYAYVQKVLELWEIERGRANGD